MATIYRSGIQAVPYSTIFTSAHLNSTSEGSVNRRGYEIAENCSEIWQIKDPRLLNVQNLSVQRKMMQGEKWNIKRKR